MKHRDGSTTFVPREGTYIPQKGHDQKSRIPAPTMEERIQEHEEIKKEYRQYLANPVKYWNGARTARPRHYASWLFPTYFLLLSLDDPTTHAITQLWLR